MAFDWNSYQTDINNTTGGPAFTTSQLQMSPNPGYYKGGSQTFDESAPGGTSVTFDPSMASPSSPTAGGGVAGTNPSGGQTPTGGAQDPQAFFNQLFPGDTLTPDMLTQNEAALKAQGITLVRNAAGVPGKIKLPNGQVVDVIQGAGSGLNRKQWLTGDSGGGTNTLGGLGFGSFVSPIGQFTPPTEQDALNSPGLQFALNEANRMGQNSAAAKGTLLNGRFQQALAASNIQNALQGYGNVYNQAANTYGINFNTQTRNQDAPYSKFFNLSQLGQQAAGAS